MLASFTDLTNDQIKKIKIGSYYYILNLDNIETLRYITDSSHCYLEEQVIDSKDSKIYTHDMVNKVNKLADDIDIYYYSSWQMIEEKEEEIERYFNRKSMKPSNEDLTKAESGIEYQKFIKSFRESVRDHRACIQEQIRRFKPHLLGMMQSFLKIGASKYDFLISVSQDFYDTYHHSNRVLYYMYWKIIEDFDYKST